MFKLDAKGYVLLYGKMYHDADIYILFTQSGYKDFRFDTLQENKDGKLNHKHG